MKTPAQQLAYVERFGRFWEASGSTRSAGRMLGWFTICEPAHQSSAQLMDVLQISSGTVSMVVRQLMSTGMIERVTFAGDRASYYHLKDHAWIQAMDAQATLFQTLGELAADGLALVDGGPHERLDDLADVTNFFVEEWPALTARLHERLSQSATT